MEIDQIASTTPLAILHGRRKHRLVITFGVGCVGKGGGEGALGFYVVS